MSGRINCKGEAREKPLGCFAGGLLFYSRQNKLRRILLVKTSVPKPSFAKTLADEKNTEAVPAFWL